MANSSFAFWNFLEFFFLNIFQWKMSWLNPRWQKPWIWMADCMSQGQLFSSSSPFPWIFLALLSMTHRVQNQNRTSCPFPSETIQLHEHVGQVRDPDVDVLIVWGLWGKWRRHDLGIRRPG